MRTLVVGDVHGCAAELTQLLAEASADEVIYVGDLFTKGPDPAGVWNQVRTSRAVLGNHDVRLLESGVEDRAAERVRKALAEVDPDWRAWMRTWPLTLEVLGFTVVHAFLHDEGPDSTPRPEAIARRFRRDLPGEPLWWRAYEGSRPVVFGHDARRGLVRVERQGRPHVIGLDTGCVYGGFLTGYLIEEDRFLHVRAREVYRSV